MDKAMTRSGKRLAVLPKGHPRRLADGRNAFRKMSTAQRLEFLKWMADEHGIVRGAGPGVWLCGTHVCLIVYDGKEK